MARGVMNHPPPPRDCERCERRYQPYRKNQRFCSSDCRYAHYADRDQPDLATLRWMREQIDEQITALDKA